VLDAPRLFHSSGAVQDSCRSPVEEVCLHTPLRPCPHDAKLLSSRAQGGCGGAGKFLRVPANFQSAVYFL
jgi:hypothetical protein